VTDRIVSMLAEIGPRIGFTFLTWNQAKGQIVFHDKKMNHEVRFHFNYFTNRWTCEYDYNEFAIQDAERYECWENAVNSIMKVRKS